MTDKDTGEQPPKDTTTAPETVSATASGKTPTGERRRRPWWVRLLKWLGISVAALVALVLVAVTLGVWILSPAKLTPLVERHASEYLNADLRANRIELTFWHTFPHLTLDVDSLRLTSRALRGLPDSIAATLPADADSLLSIGRFHGEIDLLPLLAGRIALRDVELHRPAVNLVQVNDSVANYLIMPPSEEAAEADTAAMALPPISIRRFLIEGAEPIRYRSLADSLYINLTLSNLDLADDGAPRYSLRVDSNVASPMLEEFNFDGVAFGANGNIDWDSQRPLALRLSDFALTLDRFNAQLAAAVDFTDRPMVEEFSARAADIDVAEALRHVPQEFAPFVAPLKTDMRATATVELTRPWNLADSVMPSLRGAVTVPACAVEYEALRLRALAADMEFDFDGTDMDASVFRLKRLMAKGDAIDLNLSAEVSDAISDPRIKGVFNGSVSLQRLPARLYKRLGLKASGTLKGEATFALRQSDLSRENFHRMNVKGSLQLFDFHASTPEPASAYTRHALLEFGSNSRFVTASAHTVDSLLTVSLKIDTLAAMARDIDLQVRNFRAGAGTVNRRASADTTEINPFGMSVEVENLKFVSPADSLRLRLRNAKAGGALRRFKGEARMPQINLKITVDRLMAGQALNKVALSHADVALDLHKRQRRHRTPEQLDSLRRVRALRAASSAAAPAEENLSFDMDSTERSLLRNWDFSGHIAARGGRFITPYFPLRNQLHHIDLRFSQDSIRLDNLGYRAGQSDFLVNGTISNLRRALIGRRNNTLGVNLSMVSDTVNVNEIVRALFAGAALSQKADTTMIWSDNDEATERRLDHMADTASTGPLLLPHNVDATFSLRAANVLYSDLVLHDLRGEMMLLDGALNLRDLSARTDLGSIALDGLYNGAAVDSLQFGMGMKVSNFRLDRLTSIVPAIDSLMPMMRNFAGIVNADLAVTTDLTPQMDISIPSLRAAISLTGDSLVLLDAETFKSVSKWLLFRDKKRNMIDHMEVEAVIENSSVELYPFMFNIDRYRLGVMGSNDLAMNMNYHISVLKSPIPFKFGINIKGTPEKMKIRLGGAKVKENMVGQRQHIADNTRINIVRQINDVFRRGVEKARRGRLSFSAAAGADARQAAASLLEAEGATDALSYQDSLQFIRQGLIDNPDTLRFPPTPTTPAPPSLPQKGKNAKSAGR